MKQEYLKRIIKLEKEVETIKETKADKKDVDNLMEIIAKQQEQINKLLKLNNVA